MLRREKVRWRSWKDLCWTWSCNSQADFTRIHILLQLLEKGLEKEGTSSPGKIWPSLSSSPSLYRSISFLIYTGRRSNYFNCDSPRILLQPYLTQDRGGKDQGEKWTGNNRERERKSSCEGKKKKGVKLSLIPRLLDKFINLILLLLSLPLRFLKGSNSKLIILEPVSLSLCKNARYNDDTLHTNL